MADAFSTTIWNTILQARTGRITAVNQVVEKYRPPVVAFLRSRGHSMEDAEDLAQEVFLTVVRDDLLARADRERSRFRTFLLSIVRNVMANAGRVRRASKRGGGTEPLPLDGLLRDIASPVDPDDTFDGEWIQHLLRLAVERLREVDPGMHQALRLREEDKNHEEVASIMGMTAKQAANLVQAARKKVSDLIRREIEAYCSSSEEYRDEVAYLKRYLKSPEKP
ncbi:MAG TPA: sigma-70 family RNA polymerase sigma factor [Planctomycetota bacterium]|nr:sigma-70 family RNA polymerase sigma factor [Planctomycetota bacterium]